MNEELDKKLCEKYPKIFAQRHDDAQQTLMCWGFSHGDGWYNIIDALCGNIQWHIDQQADQNTKASERNKMREELLAGNTSKFDEYYSKFKDDTNWIENRRRDLLETPVVIPELVEQVVAVQVKEKFGTLRFYYDGGDDTINGMVRMAESMSGCTCEECGAPGTRRGGGWVRTLCDTHDKKYNGQTEE